MILGVIAMGVTFLFLGPSSLFGFKHYANIWPTLVSLWALGVFWAFAMVPTYERFITYATFAHPDVNAETLMTAIGSLMYMMYMLESSLDPSLLEAYLMLMISHGL